MKIIGTIFALLITLLCVPAQAHIFKHFSDYTEIVPTKESDPRICRIHFFAKQKINDREDDPAYETNGWMLILRRGLFKAEVEMAMSQMFRYFMRYSTDLDYIEEQSDYFIARRKLQDFNEFDDTFQKRNSHFLSKIMNYKTMAVLSKETLQKDLRDLQTLSF